MSLNSPLESLKEEIAGSVKYLFEKSSCIINLDNLNQFDKSKKYDKFQLKHPYANVFIKLEIYYYSKNLKHPPDIYFIDHDDFVADLSEIEVLKNWDSNDHTCLFQFINDVFNVHFKLYNEKKLLNFNKKHVIDEYIELKQHYGCDNLQVYVNKGLDYVSINLAINLNEQILNDLAGMVDSKMSETQEDVKNYLITINYVHYRDKQQLNINHDFNGDLKAYISYKLNSNSNLTIRLPEYDDTYENMKAHSVTVIKAFTNFITSTNQNFSKRKLYINEFKEAFKTSIIEYDSKFYYYAASLISHEDFYCVLRVKLNDNYPEDAPMLTFYSIYHVSFNRQPYKQIVDNYDHKPNSSHSESVKSLKEGLFRLVERFKLLSRREGRINI